MYKLEKKIQCTYLSIVLFFFPREHANPIPNTTNYAMGFSELVGITGISIYTVKRLIFAQKIEPIFIGHPHVLHKWNRA